MNGNDQEKKQEKYQEKEKIFEMVHFDSIDLDSIDLDSIDMSDSINLSDTVDSLNKLGITFSLRRLFLIFLLIIRKIKV